MAAPRQEWCELFARIVAASCGVTLDGDSSDVLPYSPAILEAMAESDKEIG